jgi:hypothetical protein
MTGMTVRHPEDTWLRLIRAEYLEMPGLHLTRPQIQRLWHLDETVCDLLLDRLVAAGFLRQTPRGAYVLDQH